MLLEVGLARSVNSVHELAPSSSACWLAAATALLA
jgi:hypothetical protein